MAVKTKNALDKMSKADLAKYAMEAHGIVVDLDKSTKGDVVIRILDAQEDEGFGGEPERDDPENDDGVIQRRSDASGEGGEPIKTSLKASVEVDQKAAGEKRRWVKVLNEAGDQGDQPVFIGCSGDEILVKREVWVHMKQKHLNQLKAAVSTSFTEGKRRNVQRHRFEESDTKPADAG